MNKYYVMIHTTEVFETNDLLTAMRLHRNIRKDKRFYPVDVDVMERADTGVDKYIYMDSGDDDEINWSITLKGINELVKEVKENINKFLGE